MSDERLLLWAAISKSSDAKPLYFVVAPHGLIGIPSCETEAALRVNHGVLLEAARIIVRSLNALAIDFTVDDDTALDSAALQQAIDQSIYKGNASLFYVSQWLRVPFGRSCLLLEPINRFV